MATIVITGANRGIGLQLSKQLHGRGETVYAACRTSSESLDALACHVIEGVEVSSTEGIDALGTAMKGISIDWLINCAGILRAETLPDLDIDSIRQQFEVNTLGPLRVTAALQSQLTSGSKVGIITSRMGSISDNSSGGYYGYRMSKCAVNSIGKSLAIDLKPQGIAVGLLHPGFVRTEMTGGNGLIDAEESATCLIARMDALNLDNTGGFWHVNGERLPW